MKIINIRKTLSFILCGLLISSYPALSSGKAYAEGFSIVVNAKSTITADVNDIKNVYLKRQTKWSDGTEAIPFGRPLDSSEQEAFMLSVLGMSKAELDSYWASEKSKTGLKSPRKINSVSILLRQIRRKEGAFGIISSSDVSRMPDGVKVLSSF